MVILNREEIAKYCSVSKQTIFRWQKHFKFPHKKIGRSIRYLQDEVDEWVRDHSGSMLMPRKKEKRK